MKTKGETHNHTSTFISFIENHFPTPLKFLISDNELFFFIMIDYFKSKGIFIKGYVLNTFNKMVLFIDIINRS